MSETTKRAIPTDLMDTGTRWAARVDATHLISKPVPYHAARANLRAAEGGVGYVAPNIVAETLERPAGRKRRGLPKGADATSAIPLAPAFLDGRSRTGARFASGARTNFGKGPNALSALDRGRPKRGLRRISQVTEDSFALDRKTAELYGKFMGNTFYHAANYLQLVDEA